jgi:Ca2+-binding EF-hand superfamily protein
MKLSRLILCGASALCMVSFAFAQGTSSADKDKSSSGAPAASGQSGQSASGQSGQSSAAGATTARGKVPVQQNQTRKQFFDQMDKNNNGSISRSEAQASPALVIIFTELDADSNGELSAAEFEKAPLVQPDGNPVGQ